MNFFFNFFFILFFVVSYHSFCQPNFLSKNKKANKLYYEGVSFSKIGEFELALDKYNKSIKSDPNFALPYINLGEIYKKRGNYSKAISVFRNVLNNKLNYDLDKLNYMIGELYFFSGEYLNSKTYLNKVKNPILTDRRDKYLDNINFSIKTLNDSILAVPQLIESLDVFFLKYFPYYNEKDQTLYFTAREGTSLYDDENLYYIKRISKKNDWGEIMKVSKTINSENNEGSISFSSDKNTMVFSFCTSSFKGQSCDLYFSKKNNGIWGIPKKLNDNINSEYWESHPSLSSDGNYLFFSSNRPGGYGGKDIWMSRKKGKDWGIAKNLGDSVNTMYNEIAPFLHNNMIDFYFSSNGRKSFGGYDIYHGLFNKNLIKDISNFGYPINNHFNQSSMNVSGDGKLVFYTNEEYVDEKVKSSQIYFANLENSILSDELFYFSGKVLDKKTEKLIPWNIEIKNLSNDKIDKFNSVDQNEEFYFLLNKDIKYEIYVKSEGYNYNVFLFEEKTSQYQNIYLDPVAFGLKLEVKNIYFDLDDDQLYDDSKGQLDILANWLKSNPSVRLEISGHTDDSGTEQYNMDLSRRRAFNVYKYLTEKYDRGAEQITYIAYGNKRPIYTGADEERKKENRRIEFKIISQ